MQEQSQSLSDRHAISVRAAAVSLNDALMRETDSLLKMGAPYMEQAKANFGVCMSLTSALVSDDVGALERILDVAG